MSVVLDLKIYAKKIIDENFDPFVPRPSINYNASSKSRRISKKQQFEPYAQKVLPFLLETYLSKNGSFPETFRFLDIGCGFGPLPYALRFLEQAISKKVKYVGIDIRPESINWLRNAYQDYPDFEFLLQKASKSVDYVASERGETHTVIESDGSEGSYELSENYDIQWSASVLTSMTKEATFLALKKIASNSGSNALQINTWFIIDDMSRYAMASGIADRKLPIDLGDFLTYSASNPLACLAYKEELIYNLYTSAGLEIVKILPGSWRGYTDNHVHYQDIIVSQKKE